MNKDLVRRLILYLADQLNDKEAPVSTIRLVKLLYLIDYEFFKKHQKTLTGVSWIRYHYGPYFMALPTILSAARIDLDAREVENERGKALVYTSLEPQSISEIVDFGTEGLINRIIERWCLEELPILLKHVYRTEPMKEAPYGESLDFSVISHAPVSRRAHIHIKLDKSGSDKIQGLLVERRRQRKMPEEKHYDKYYLEAIEVMDNEDTTQWDVSGMWTISPDIAESLSEQIE